MNKIIQELMYKMDIKQLKKYLSQIIGHKVDEIITRVNCGGKLIIRLRHETYAYSNIRIIEENNNIKYYWENFETGGLDEILITN